MENSSISAQEKKSVVNEKIQRWLKGQIRDFTQNKRPKIVGFVFAFSAYLFYVISLVKLPEVFIFNFDNHQPLMWRLFNSDVHLDDDVMISMRVGLILNQTGIPSFNKTDLAQPSTSYFAPYLFSALARLLPSNLAILAFAAITFVGVTYLLVLLVLKSKSQILGMALILLVILTDTFKMYSLTGWDHNLQSLFCCLAIWIALREKLTLRSASLVSLFLFLSVGFRPDSAIIAAGVFLGLGVRDRKSLQLFLAGGFFAVLIGILMYSNWKFFGSFTPTTSRLKLGGTFSFSDSASYIVKETSNFSILNIGILSLVIYIVLFRFFPLFLIPIVVSCFFTMIYSVAVTDVFNGVRMSWTPTLVMILLILKYLPSPFGKQLIKIRCEIQSAFGQFSMFNSAVSIIPIFIASFILIAVPMVYQSYERLAYNNSIIRTENASPTSSQYALANWMEKNLEPTDGSIGLYWLGIGYHLPSFEIADFLGKADELIASQPVKWGPPGHNKWNTGATIRKWNPQVIFPSISDLRDISVEESKKWIANRENFGFIADLRLNQIVLNSYSYCTTTEGMPKKQSWNFFLRNDLMEKHSDAVNCVPVNWSS